MPVAPLSRTCATSSGSSMLACSSTVDAVEGGGARVAQALELLPLELPLVLAQAVLGERLLVGSTMSHALRAVDDHQVVFAHQLPRVVQGDDRRDVQAARDDGGVRSGAAQVGDEARELVLLELDDVRGRQVVRDEDQIALGLARRRRHVAGVARQRLHHALDDLDARRPCARAGSCPRSASNCSSSASVCDLERPLGVALLVLDRSRAAAATASRR